MEGRVDIKILCGKDLFGMDFSGKSDPYVEVFQGDKMLHKTAKKANTLNPEWNEQFSFYLMDQSGPIIFKVLDRDLPDKDDFMGEAHLDLTALGINRSEEVSLQLSAGDDDKLARKAEKKHKSLGLIIVRVCTTKVQDGSIEKLDFFTETLGTSSMKASMPFSSLMSNSTSPSDPFGMVHIVMVQAKRLIPSDVGNTINSFCKVSLGSGNRKTKIILDSLNPKWRQGFVIPWYKGQDDYIEMFIHDSKTGGEESDQVGRSFINLRELKQEISHNLWLPIKDSSGSRMPTNNTDNLLNIEKEGELNAIVTISGLSDIKEEVSPKDEEEKEEILKERFALSNTFSNMEDIGHLQVKVVQATGLCPEFIGKRNPFVVLQVGNSRVQTNSCNGTINPEWNRTFKFDIKDVYAVLEVAIFDDDGDRDGDFPCELLGKIQIPLLNIDSGKEKWYRLKDHSLRNSAKGEDPRILIRMKFIFNSVRASSCVFKPKTIKYEETQKREFEMSKFKHNFWRMMRVKQKCLLLKQTILNIFEWHNPFVSFCGLIVIPAIIWHFDVWMIPAFLLLFLTCQILKPLANANQEEDDGDEEIDNQNDRKMSMMETLEMLQQKALWMQEGMGEVAGAIESLENVLNFSVPFISWFIYIFFLVVTIFLYFAPLRLLVLIWVVNRFRKGLLKNRTDTNEVINFLSRVPDNEELKNYQEL